MAIAVGIEGNPLGRNVLEPLVSVLVFVLVAEAIGILRLKVVPSSAATVGTSTGSSDVIT